MTGSTVMVDAINEPDRVIPSGRMPGRWGLGVAIVNSILSMIVASFLGMTVFIAAAIGLALAWAYSAARPSRPQAKRLVGQRGPAAFSYETLPWITAAAAALGTVPGGRHLCRRHSLWRRRDRHHDAQ